MRRFITSFGLIALLLAMCARLDGGGLASIVHAAGPWNVSITIHQAISLTDNDTWGEDDMYAVVLMLPDNGGAPKGCSFFDEHEDDNNTIFPEWTCHSEVSGDDPIVNIILVLKEHDTDPNDHFDIHPAASIDDITISFKPADDTLSILDVPAWENAQCAMGKIKLQGQEGVDQAAVVFSVSAAQAPTGDTDGDGLPDSWEKCGVDTDGDHTVDIDLPAMGANPLRRDVFVEIDWMVSGDHIHAPWLPALINAWYELDTAPVTNLDPLKPNGIALHVDVGTHYSNYAVNFDGAGLPEIAVGPDGNYDVNGDGVIDIGNLAALGGDTASNSTLSEEMLSHANGSYLGPGSTFADLKANPANFDPARNEIFHYAIFGHQMEGQDKRSGMACLGSCNDFIVSLGAWPRQTLDANKDGVPDPGAPALGGPGVGPTKLPVDGTIRQHTGAFLHELGHTLGLDVGGGDGVNFKPNYISIMNYSFQMRGIQYDLNGDGLANRLEGLDRDRNGIADFQRYAYTQEIPPAVLPSLNEAALDEPLGIGDGQALTLHGPGTNTIGWFVAAGNAPIDWNGDGDMTGLGVSSNINADPIFPEILTGFNDHQHFQNNPLIQTESPGISWDAQQQLELNTNSVIALPDEQFITQRCTAVPARITFEDLPIGSVVSNQFAPLVTFLDDSARTPRIAGQGERNNMPTISERNSLANHSLRNQHAPLVFEFGEPQRLVGLYLGRVTAITWQDTAVITAFDVNGHEMGQVRRSIPNIGPGITSFLGVGAIFHDRFISRIELHYESGEANVVPEPAHIDDLVFCQRLNDIAIPSFPDPPSFGDLPVTVGVAAKAITEGSPVAGEPGHYLQVVLPLTGVPISLDNGVQATDFSFIKKEGTSVTLDAPLVYTSPAGIATFLHWKLELDGDQVFFPEGENKVSLKLLRNAALTAVYQISRRLGSIAYLSYVEKAGRLDAALGSTHTLLPTLARMPSAVPIITAPPTTRQRRRRQP